MVKYKVDASRGSTCVRVDAGLVGGTEREKYDFSCEDYMKALNLIQKHIEDSKQELIRVHESGTIPEASKDKNYKTLFYGTLSYLATAQVRALPEGSKLELFLEIPDEKK